MTARSNRLIRALPLPMTIPLEIAGALALLILTCSAGAQETTSRPAPAEFETGVRTARPGDVLLMPDSMKLAEVARVPWRKSVSPDAPQLLFSDKPEYFRTGDGIAMQEDVKPGTVRLYLYHCPDPAGGKKTISAVIENLGDAPLHLRFTRYAHPEPGFDYHKIGKQGLLDYFRARVAAAPKERALSPHERAVIDPKLDAQTVTKDMLVHGLFEFTIDQPARITTFERDPSQQSTTIIDTLPKLPRILPGEHPSGAGRGLFLSSNFDVTTPPETPVLDLTGGPMQLVLADGRDDPWISGRDSLSPDATEPDLNKGNYGVMYRVRLSCKLPEGKGLAVLLANDRTGKWCGQAAAAVKVNAAGNGAPPDVVALPRDTVRFGIFPQAVLIQRITPTAPDQPVMVDLTYSPPGASCLPLPIVLVPYDPT